MRRKREKEMIIISTANWFYDLPPHAKLMSCFLHLKQFVLTFLFIVFRTFENPANSRSQKEKKGKKKHARDISIKSKINISREAICIIRRSTQKSFTFRFLLSVFPSPSNFQEFLFFSLVRLTTTISTSSVRRSIQVVVWAIPFHFYDVCSLWWLFFLVLFRPHYYLLS